MTQDPSTESREPTVVGRITLKQMKVQRATNPVNLLVPYLDLFWRLDDEEIGRLALVEPEIVGGLRKQVIEIERALAGYVDLLSRLSDAELVRLTGATEKTIRFWRLCQPRSISSWRKRALESDEATRSPAIDETTGRNEPGEGADDLKECPPPARRDSRVTINPAAQATVDAMMTFSGAPFPGYDGNEAQVAVPSGEISLEDLEGSRIDE